MPNIFSQKFRAPSGVCCILVFDALAARINFNRAIDRGNAVDLIVDQRMGIEVMLRVAQVWPTTG